MSEDPNHPWGSGATRYHYRSDVQRVVQRTLNRFSALTANTYVCHPWCGWADQSVDFWHRYGRGDPLPAALSWSTARFLLDLPGDPQIRHLIVEHSLWTSWGGWSDWTRDDHSGSERHVHVTYW